jgi:5-methylcytosine-specific restriction endonuclease McrA
VRAPNRQSKWAQRKRAEVTFILGGKCAHCGTKESLTFDCIRPVNAGHHKMSSSARMTFYVREMRKGNLQILCHACNVKKSNRPNGKYITSTLPPYPALPMSQFDCDELEAFGNANLHRQDKARKTDCGGQEVKAKLDLHCTDWLDARGK